jgi:2-hydroxy-3-oxopropionate reductase
VVNVTSQRLENQMQKAGFIGLGIMGTPMAANLRRGGVELVAFTKGAVPADLTQAGVVAADSAAAVAAQADVIFIMVPDTPDVERVLLVKTAWPRACAPVRSWST